MKNKVLFLTLNTFSKTGGIEDVCRTFCKVLTDSNTSFEVYAMHDDQSDPAYVSANNFKGFNASRIAFGFSTIIQGLKSEIIILSHVNLLLFAGIIKLLAPKKRIIMYAHGIEVWRKLSVWKQYFLKNYAEIWAVSNFTAEKLQEMHKIPAQNIKILNNCLSPYFIYPKVFEKPPALLRRYKLDATQPVLFTLTRISDSEKYKGYDIVIQVLPRLIKIFPGLQYIISGKAGGKERDRIVHLIKKHKLQDHVFLSGFVDYNELSDHFLLADCFVLPSKKEGFGIVFIESAACGCNVLAGNKDGSADALLNGELGTLVDPDDQDAIFNALKRILEKPKSLDEAKKIQQKCLEHFSFNHYKERVALLLDPNVK